MVGDINLAVRPGRPPQFSGDERRRILFDAAEDVFLQKGYNAATMNDIAQRARMSKKTVYQVFPAKTALFDALLHERWAILMAPLRNDGEDPQEVLIELLMKLTIFVLSPRQIAMMRVMISESQRSPDMALALERQCLGRGDSAVEAWLIQQAKRGSIIIENPGEEASMLVGSIFSKMLFDLIFEVISQPTEAEIEARIRKAVRIFLKGLAASN